MREVKRRCAHMRTIGIKLADGSFYPVLEEFSNSEKELDLTTAHNNQTKVMVDLYRSKTCSMEDAEYVDSLQIENMVAHPNGEPDISFTVSIDENNKLSAKIKDSETGNQSKTTITLVSRTVEERLSTDEYKISDSKEKPKTKKHGFLAMAEKLRENETEKTTDNDADFNIQETEIEEKNPVENEKQTEHENNTIIAFTPAADDEINRQKKLETIDDVMLPNDNTDEQIIWPEDTEQTQIIEDEIPVDSSEKISDDNISNEIQDYVSDEISIDVSEEIPADVSDNIPEVISDEISVDIPENITDDVSDVISDETELPELNFDFPGDDSKETLENAASEFNQQTDDIPQDFFDFDNPLEQDNSQVEIKTNSDENLFAENDNAFNFDENTYSLDSTDDNSLDEDIFTEDSISNSSVSSHGPLSFTGLYDKETELGQSGEDEKIKKKTKVPVIICVICAIICIIATLLILFIVPSKYNLLNKGISQNQEIEQTTEKPITSSNEDLQIVPEIENEPEPETTEQVAPPAQEEEIVVVEQAEIVVPEQPPVTPEKPKDIDYKIKWGDTLWDIADTYYKNPWRYKYIARFNNIKNPDYIISGTYITIPAE